MADDLEDRVRRAAEDHPLMADDRAREGSLSDFGLGGGR